MSKPTTNNVFTFIVKGGYNKEKGGVYLDYVKKNDEEIIDDGKKIIVDKIGPDGKPEQRTVDYTKLKEKFDNAVGGSDPNGATDTASALPGAVPGDGAVPGAVPGDDAVPGAEPGDGADTTSDVTGAVPGATNAGDTASNVNSDIAGGKPPTRTTKHHRKQHRTTKKNKKRLSTKFRARKINK